MRQNKFQYKANSSMNRSIIDKSNKPTYEIMERIAHVSSYCKFGNFRENFIFGNSVKRHICDVNNSRLRHDLHVPISVKDRVISPFREHFIFTKLRICEVSRI